ncbi:unnamed protein product [Nyctereutes procyonoides]|uniref:(raccoon dog) hypothetical protein n=1 Tax=Nyctereutes procyonoides TaxID=34880 RepID=A0A811YKG1_NYCPR|nr:unnamed protein product [Nyctereutes procyonoides]
MTKLFQSNDPTLFRMCFLIIKEISCIDEDIVIIASTLTMEMTRKEDDHQGLAVECYMKQALIDKVLSCSFVKLWYHALGFVYPVHKKDHLDVNKLISRFTEHSLMTPFAYGMMMQSCLPNKHNMVVYETALSIAIAVCTLNKVAMKHLSGVMTCNLDIENLITYLNCSITTSRPSVPELSSKHAVVMNFLFTMLWEETSLRRIQKARELRLLYLCEFIEDCEFTMLATRVLHLLGQEGVLAKFGAQKEEMCVMNDDSEARDQDTYYFNILERNIRPSRTKSTPITAAKQPEKVLATVPEFHGWGPFFKSSLKPVTLIEPETEYVITAPNIPSQTTWSSSLTLETHSMTRLWRTSQCRWSQPTEAYQMLCCKSAPNLSYNQPGTCYTLVAPQMWKEDPTDVACTFSCITKFTVKDYDTTTGEIDDEGYKDEYVMKLNSETAWDEVGDEFEKEETFTLSSIKTLEEAVGNMVKFLGMSPCENSQLLLLDMVRMQMTVGSSEKSIDIILTSVG